MNADAECATFLSLKDKGGLDVVVQVGPCQRADCVNNDALECRAPLVSVGSAASGADCLSYSRLSA